MDGSEMRWLNAPDAGLSLTFFLTCNVTRSALVMSVTELQHASGSNSSSSSSSHVPATATATGTLTLSAVEDDHRPMQFGLAPPTFTDKHAERAYVKERLALAYRVVAHTCSRTSPNTKEGVELS